MRVFDFNRAIVREPGRSVVKGLRTGGKNDPNLEALLKEHRAYVAALREAGLDVTVLPPLEEYPDAVFVEDPALTFGEGAILMRPGAPSRLGETTEMARVLEQFFPHVLRLEGDEYADGGDVLVTPELVFIGLSARTTRTGAEALAAKLAVLGRKACVAETPANVLHFKSASALISDDVILATKALATSGVFAGFDVIVVPEDEEDAANAIRVNDTVFIGTCFPKTIELLKRSDFEVVALPVTEIRNLDAGLSCMSLRWHA